MESDSLIKELFLHMFDAESAIDADGAPISDEIAFSFIFRAMQPFLLVVILAVCRAGT